MLYTCVCAGLTRLMASSRDYDELLWAWKGWRDVTRPLMKDGYQKFVNLSNEAVQTLGMRGTVLVDFE